MLIYSEISIVISPVEVVMWHFPPDVDCGTSISPVDVFVVKNFPVQSVPDTSPVFVLTFMDSLSHFLKMISPVERVIEISSFAITFSR